MCADTRKDGWGNMFDSGNNCVREKMYERVDKHVLKSFEYFSVQVESARLNECTSLSWRAEGIKVGLALVAE